MSEQRIVPQSWGRERFLEENEKYVVKMLEVDPGHRLSLQHHDRMYKTFYCVYGHATLFFTHAGLDAELSLLPGRYRTIEPDTIYNITSSATAPCIIMQISSYEPNDTRVLGPGRFLNPHDH